MSEFTVLYDSLCPVCSREVNFLRKINRKGLLKVEDITSPDFEPRTYGLTMEQCIGSLHGITGDGRIVEGMETVREMYRAVGLGWTMAWTRWWPLSLAADKGYAIFAHYRPRFSSFDKEAACEKDRCKI